MTRQIVAAFRNDFSTSFRRAEEHSPEQLDVSVSEVHVHQAVYDAVDGAVTQLAFQLMTLYQLLQG